MPQKLTEEVRGQPPLYQCAPETPIRRADHPATSRTPPAPDGPHREVLGGC
jgi:hypothetical protein